ncbi:MAG: hypothetical protein HIU81_11010 [Acidobacteria bacterium]|nr:hypothetical protein [Acidobacteriota bacterium]
MGIGPYFGHLHRRPAPETADLDASPNVSLFLIWGAVPWLVLGSLVDGLSLIGMGFGCGPVQLKLAWIMVQIWLQLRPRTAQRPDAIPGATFPSLMSSNSHS